MCFRKYKRQRLLVYKFSNNPVYRYELRRPIKVSNKSQGTNNISSRESCLCTTYTS